MDLSYSDPQGLSLNTELTVNDMRVSAEHSRYSKFLFRCNYINVSNLYFFFRLKMKSVIAFQLIIMLFLISHQSKGLEFPIALYYFVIINN